MSLLPLTSFYAGGKQNDDPIRQYFTLIVSIHLYIVIFVSQHFSCIPISKDEYSLYHHHHHPLIDVQYEPFEGHLLNEDIYVCI
jgi:hypothetical protein